MPDVQILRKVLEVNSEEKLLNQRRGLNSSQNGNYENIRNCTFQQVPFVLDSTYDFTHSDGKLEFDYVSTYRPPADTKPMNETKFKFLMKRLQLYVLWF